MLLQVVWPDHDWAESAMLARLDGMPQVFRRRQELRSCAETPDS